MVYHILDGVVQSIWKNIVNKLKKNEGQVFVH